MTKQDMNPFADDAEDSAAVDAAVRDVFGIDIGGGDDSTSSAAADKVPEDGAGQPPASADGPSVGTDGDEAGDDKGGQKPAKPDPASSTPSPAEGGEPDAASAQPKADGKPPEGTPGQEPPKQPTADHRDLELASLRAQLEAANATLASLKPEGSKPSEGSQPSDKGKPDEPIVPPVKVQLPDELAGAIFGEDPQQAKQGIDLLLSVLATGMAARMEHRARAIEAKIEQRFNDFGQQGQQEEAQRSAEEARADYFKHYPDHNSPVILPILQVESQKLAAELPGLSWDDKFRDALGQRMNTLLTEAGFKGATPAQPATNPPTGQDKPAPMVPGGTRTPPEGEDEVRSVFAAL